LWFERRFSKQNSVICLKSNILAPQNFSAGYPTANDTSSSGVRQVYRAWGKPQFKRSQPVRGSIKQKKHCNLMLYLQLSNSKDKVFLPFLLKMYRLYCQKADMI